MAHQESGSHVRALDESLLGTVSKAIQEKRSEHLRGTERQTMEAFQERLDIVGKMRPKDSKSAETGLTPAEARKLLLDLEDNRQLREKLQEQMERAETQARGCVREVQRMQGALGVAAADRETLLQTLMACRKELARKEAELERERARVQELEQATQEEGLAAEALAERSREASAAAAAAGGGGGGGGPSLAGPQDEVTMYRQRLQQVQSLLEHERRVVREVRQELRQDRALRTEAEVVLRAAIAEARREMEATRQSTLAGLKVSSKRQAAPPTELPSADALLPAASRASLLRDLLSQEAILNGLIPVVFPQGHARTLEGLAVAERKAAVAAAAAAAAGGSAASK
jgi:hypothetical protein